MIWFYILLFIISSIILIRSGFWVIQSLTRIAKFLEWKEFTVAFILMAFATSMPELFVGITSALHKSPALSLGNIIGSNIINLTLLVALGAIMANGLKLETIAAKRDSLYTALIAFLPIILMLDGKISRIDGGLLLLILIFYFKFLLFRNQRFAKIFTSHSDADWKKFKQFIKDMGIFLCGIALLLVSAEGIVMASSKLAVIIGIPLAVVGTLLIAFGTNLPEMVFGIKAILMKKRGMVLGNLMGSVVANSTLVLGITVLICPLEITDFTVYAAGIMFTILSALFFYLFARSNNEISRKEGFFLLGIYLVFIATQLITY